MFDHESLSLMLQALAVCLVLTGIHKTQARSVKLCQDAARSLSFILGETANETV